MNTPAREVDGSAGGSLSLRVKLVLSYLGVALGAIMLMVTVVAFAVQNYFYQSQVDQLRAETEQIAQQLAQAYRDNGNSWNGISLTPKTSMFSPYLSAPVVFVDAQGVSHSPYLSTDFLPYDTTIQQALILALHGQETTGKLQGDASDPDVFSGIYVCTSVKLNAQTIGALFVAQPNRYPRGFSPSAFLAKVDLVILITGVGIAFVVVAFSLFMARRLTRPLALLIQAAEQMKAGNYNQRVEQPGSQDELGRLALTFNAMADKIAADVNELRKQEQVRRDLIANIAHDLITPLTAIQGYSEAIGDDIISVPEQRHETAQLIGREVQRLRRLVSDMQNMTALETGRVTLEIASLNLHDLVVETLAVIAPECEQAHIELHNTLDPSTPAVLADSDRIIQVLLNLLDNARRHTPAGGQIRLGARSEGRRLVAWVSDTGVGINPQDLPSIFERFYRVDRSRNAASGGSGLGLAIIKAIISAHSGTVWAQSKPGQGTTIFFTLPLAPLPTRPAPGQKNA
ncbi:MAG TPA: ATP-binding protein [Ktedonobacteraceae bacterium]|jgi:signal transduction histidine kinase